VTDGTDRAQRTTPCPLLRHDVGRGGSTGHAREREAANFFRSN
jgi:hypothetical protein